MFDQLIQDMVRRDAEMRATLPPAPEGQRWDVRLEPQYSTLGAEDSTTVKLVYTLVDDLGVPV